MEDKEYATNFYIERVSEEVHKQVRPYIDQMVIIQMKIGHFKSKSVEGYDEDEVLSKLTKARKHYEMLILEVIEREASKN